MTLALTLVTPHGVWQSADCRLSRAGETISDKAMKIIVVECRDALITVAYSGVGRIAAPHDEIEISEWISEFARGRQRRFEEFLVTLARSATDSRRFGDALWYRAHQFVIAGFATENPPSGFFTSALERSSELVISLGRVPPKRTIPLFALVSNYHPGLVAQTQARPKDIQRRFRIAKVPQALRYYRAGDIHRIPSKDDAEIKRALQRHTENPRHHAGLLAATTQRTAIRSPVVSKRCRVVYLAPSCDSVHVFEFEDVLRLPARPQMPPMVVGSGMDMTAHFKTLGELLELSGANLSKGTLLKAGADAHRPKRP